MHAATGEEDVAVQRYQAEKAQHGSTMGRLRLRDFLPGLSKQKDVLDAHILRMTPSKFVKLCPNTSKNTSDHELAQGADRNPAREQINADTRDQGWEDCSDDGFDFDHLLDQVEDNEDN